MFLFCVWNNLEEVRQTDKLVLSYSSSNKSLVPVPNYKSKNHTFVPRGSAFYTCVPTASYKPHKLYTISSHMVGSRK
jgi:hypothetical protein